MQSFQTFFGSLAVVTLAACGGGSGAGSLAPAGYGPGTRDPSGSSVGFERATLWVGYDDAVKAYSVNDGTLTGPAFTLGFYMYDPAYIPGIVDVAIAPDGTKWVLENHSFALGGPGFRLLAYAPIRRDPTRSGGLSDRFLATTARSPSRTSPSTRITGSTSQRSRRFIASDRTRAEPTRRSC